METTAGVTFATASWSSWLWDFCTTCSRRESSAIFAAVLEAVRFTEFATSMTADWSSATDCERRVIRCCSYTSPPTSATMVISSASQKISILLILLVYE